MDKVVFFDVGGTLIRPAREIGCYYSEMAAHYGVQTDAALLTEGFRQAWQDMKNRDPVAGPRVLDDKGWWKSLVRLSWSRAGLPEAFPFDDYFEELYRWFERPEVWRIFPEVEECLAELRVRGYRLGILSNWDRRLRTILSGLELSGFFEDMIISSEVGVEKPHPRIFDIARQRFQIKSSEAILIGDEPAFDGAGAISAGWTHVVLKRPEIDLRDALAKVL